MRRMKYCYSALLTLLLCVPTVPSYAVPIEQVEVELRDVQQGTSAPLLARMQKSIQVVAEQLLLTKDTENLRSSQADYSRLLTEVADRALTGYQVERLSLQLSRTSVVRVALAPWHDTVKDVQVEVLFSGLDSKSSQELLDRVPTLRQDIIATVKGASADATDWAQGIVRARIQQQLEQALPDFRAAVDLTGTGPKVQVQVIIYPVGQTIKSIEFDFLSNNLPNLLFKDVRTKFQTKVDELRGMPVLYLQKNQAQKEKELASYLSQQKVVQLYGAKPVVKLTVGANTTIAVALDSPRYKVWIEGYGDVGRNQNNISGKIHIGKYMSGADELFAETSVVLDKGSDWELAPGYARKMGNVTLSYARRITDKENDYRLEYDFAPKWRLRAEYFSGEANYEFGLRYRIHEYLSAEYVYAKDKPYLRIIGNL